MQFNGTSKCHYFPDWKIVYGKEFLLILHVLAVLIAVPGNALIIFLVLRSQRLRQEASYLFICSACLADAMLNVVGVPLSIVQRLERDPSARICQAAAIAMYLFSCSSGTAIIGVTIDRFVYIIYPLHYEQYMTRKTALRIIACLWLGGTIVAVIPFAFYHKEYSHALVPSVIAVCRLVAMAVHLKFYCIALTLHRRTVTLKPVQRGHSQLQLTIMITCLTWAYGIFFLPYSIAGIVYALADSDGNPVIISVFYWTCFICCLNSCGNIFIYYMKNSVLKREFWNMIRKKIRKDVTHVESYTMTSIAKD